MPRTYIALLALLAGSVSAACTSVPTPTPVPSDRPPAEEWIVSAAERARKNAILRAGPSDYVVANLKVEVGVPGMGGFGVLPSETPSNAVVVHLRSPSDTFAFRSALSEFVENDAGFRAFRTVNQLIVRRADFPFSELVAAQLALDSAFTANDVARQFDAVVGVYADPRINRVRLDVGTPAIREHALQVARSLHIPAAMLVVNLVPDAGRRD